MIYREKYQNLVFVDCEARGISPVNGTMTEFGAVHFGSRQSFHGQLYEGKPDPENPAVPLIGKKLNSERRVAVPPVRSWGFWLDGKFRKANKWFLSHGHHPCS